MIYIQVLGDCIRWIDRKVHGDTYLSKVWIGEEQQYSESPDA